MVVHAEGRPVRSLDIDLSVWSSEGFNKITYRMEPDKEYEIIVVNRRDNMLYTVKGIYKCFGSYNPYSDGSRADWIIMDCSSNVRARRVQFDIRDIRAIKEIETV